MDANTAHGELIKQTDFMAAYLDTLDEGSAAFHGQLFPNAYPPDQALHDNLKQGRGWPAHAKASFAGYLAYIAGQHDRGVAIQRLRTLPDAFTDDVPPMIELCQEVASVGEEVRLCLFDRQLGRLALAGLPRQYTQDLTAPVPRAGIWSTRNPAAGGTGPQVIGLMHYNDDGTYPGITVYRQPDQSLLAYERFWYQVFNNPAESVAVEDWQQLYN